MEFGINVVNMIVVTIQRTNRKNEHSKRMDKEKNELGNVVNPRIMKLQRSWRMRMTMYYFVSLEEGQRDQMWCVVKPREKGILVIKVAMLWQGGVEVLHQR